MARLTRLRDLMKAVLPTADVQGYERHTPDIMLPDPDDRHIVAAAIAGKASLVVTWNTADFPQAELAKYGLRRETPDELMLGLHAAAPAAVIASVASARLNLRASTPDADVYVTALERQGLIGFATILRQHLANL